MPAISNNMRLLLQAAAEGAVSVPLMRDLDVRVDWPGVINNAVTLKKLVPAGLVKPTGSQRAYKTYVLARVNPNVLPVHPVHPVMRFSVPACFDSEREFLEWRAAARMVREGATICSDCKKNSPWWEALDKSRCHEKKWSKVLFGFRTRFK
jgi:hypothetical protein